MRTGPINSGGGSLKIFTHAVSRGKVSALCGCGTPKIYGNWWRGICQQMPYRPPAWILFGGFSSAVCPTSVKSAAHFSVKKRQGFENAFKKIDWLL